VGKLIFLKGKTSLYKEWGGEEKKDARKRKPARKAGAKEPGEE
jgi:hypothetical protein